MPRLCMVCVALFACSSGTSISQEPLKGKVGGSDFTLGTGHTSAFLSAGENDFFATLYRSSFEACGIGTEPSEEGHLILSIPKTPGTYEFGFDLNATFVVQDDENLENLATLSGAIEVKSVDGNRVVGGVNARYDGDNFVDGQFSVTVCD